MESRFSLKTNFSLHEPEFLRNVLPPDPPAPPGEQDVGRFVHGERFRSVDAHHDCRAKEFTGLGNGNYIGMRRW